MTTLREKAIAIAFHFLGEPYRWGGDDPLAGFDCSGLMIEILRSVGCLPRGGDWTAAQLATHWPRTEALRPGCLLFWASGGAITHVEMVYQTAPLLTIGASGGGSKTTDRAAAIAQDAYVKIRPARAGWVQQVDPFTGPT